MTHLSAFTTDFLASIEWMQVTARINCPTHRRGEGNNQFFPNRNLTSSMVGVADFRRSFITGSVFLISSQQSAFPQKEKQPGTSYR